jgi:predicted permease
MTVELSVGGPKPILPLRAKTVLFALIGVMYIYVLVTNETFLIDRSDPEWTHIAPFKLWLLPHGMSAAFALFLGPFQFSERLRRKYITVHKTFGYLYIAGCFIGAPLGIYIQWFEERFGAARSFTMAAGADAVLWIFATGMALWMIRSGRMQQHRQWMIRSFSCALIFLEVRSIAVFFRIPETLSETVVWCCVAAAYPIADLVLQIDELRRKAARPVRA